MTPSIPQHDEIVEAVRVVTCAESALTLPLTGFADLTARYRWMTEVDLMAQLRDRLVARGCADAWNTRLNGAGRLAKESTNHDIEIGSAPTVAIEGVFCFARKKPMPGKTLSDDLTWLAESAGNRHVVAFLPRIVVGLRVSGPLALDGSALALGPTDRLLVDVIQAEGLESGIRSLCEGVFLRVDNPPAGRAARWSLAPSIRPLTHASVKRSVVGSPSDPLWAIIWSH